MNKELNVMADSMQHSRKGWKRWRRIVSSLACVVVFVTTYALILPAITKEKETFCGLEVHEHSEECYSEGLTCTLSEEGHLHTDECYTVRSELTCELEEEHTESCYTEHRELTCTLEEQEPHTHGEACYGKILSCGKEAHAHTLRCYSSNLQELAAAIAREEQEAGHGAEFYRARYGAAEDADWTVLFAAYVLDQAGVDKEALSFTPNAEQWLDTLYNAEDPRLQSPKAHAPAAGDIVFLEEDEVITLAVVAKADNDSLTLVGADEEGAALADAKLENAPIAYVLTLEAPEAPVEKVGSDEEVDPVEPEATPDEDVVYVSASSNGIILDTDEDHGSVAITPYYRSPDTTIDPDDPDASWTELTAGTKVGADYHFKIKGSYKNIDIGDIAANGYKLRYKIQDFLADIVTIGDIDVNGEKRGEIYAEDGYIVMEFNQRWIDNLVRTGNTMMISGSFEYEGGLDLKKLEDAEGNGLKLGDIVLDVPDWQSARAQFAEVNLRKTSASKLIYDEASDRYFLEYTIEVTAGAYGSPNVTVIDTLSGNPDFFEGRGYVGIGTNSNLAPVETITPSGSAGEVYMTSANAGMRDNKPAANANGNNMAWHIGDMEPNEVRTLTYKVELSKEYVGIPHSAANSIGNRANLFSEEYPRGGEPTIYAPYTETQLVKDRVGNPHQDEKGLWHVTFRVRVTADRDNSYRLDNLKIYDVVNRNYGTNYKQFINLVEDSVVIFDEDGVTPIEDITPFVEFINGTSNPVVIDPENPRDFNIYIGDLYPGQSRYIQYEMTLDENAALPYINGTISLYNTAELYTDETRGNEKLKSDGEDIGVGSQYWTRKMQSEQSREDKTIQMNTNQVSDGVVNKVLKLENGVFVDDSTRSYTIPSGAFGYSVVVNEKGNVDVSSAIMQDNLSGLDSHNNKLLKYTGYVQVDVYNQVPGMNSDAAVKNYLQGNTPKQTVWVKIDDLDSFQFTADKLGIVETIDPITGDKQDNAYILTYYTIINPDASDFNRATAGNHFGLSGKVGPGEGVELVNVYSSVSATVIETGTEQPHKSAWYYDKDDTVFVDYQDGRYNCFDTGAMYWVITFTGSKVPFGMRVEDSTRVGNVANGDYWNWDGGTGVRDQLPNSISRHDVSWIGLYSGFLGFDEENNPIEFQDKFASLDEALSSGLLKEVQIYDPNEPAENNGYYSVKWTQGNAVYPNMNTGAFGKDPNGETYWDLSVKIERAYGLATGERLFALIRTQPTRLPQNETLVYQNKFNYQANANAATESEKDKDKFVLSDITNGIKKNVGGIYSVKDGVVTTRVAGSDGTMRDANNSGPYDNGLLTDVAVDWSKDPNAQWNSNIAQNGNLALEDGQYITWQLEVNTLDLLRGDFTLFDQIPAGLDLVYIRPYSIAKNFSDPVGRTADDWARWNTFFNGPGLTRKKDDEIPGSSLNGVGLDVSKGWCFTVTGEKENISPEWEMHMAASRCHSTSYATTAKKGDGNRTMVTYYTKPNAETGGTDVQVYFPYLTAGMDRKIVLQAVTKANSDLSPFEDHELNNQIQLYDSKDKMVDDRGATVKLKAETANKAALLDGLKTGSVTTSKFPYEIEINQSGIDMVENSDFITVPLIDRMSGNLSLANDTLAIFKAPAYNVGPNGLPLNAEGHEVAKSSSDIDYIWANCVYYGGTYNSYVGDTWYNPAKDGQTVGYIGDAPAGKEIVVSVETSLDANGEPILFNGKPQTDVKFRNLPDSTPLVLCYSVNATFDGANGSTFSNKAFWEGFENNENGDVESDRVYYQAKSNGHVNAHGALVINKYDSKSLSKPLAGAKFALYRIEYRDHSDGFLSWDLNVPADAEVRNKRNLAVYLGSDSSGYHDVGTHVELRVRRDANGAISMIQVPKDKNRTTSSASNTDSAFKWIDLETAFSEGYDFHHEPVLDADGNIKVYWDEVLSRGITDESGKLSYGLATPYGKLLDEDGKPIDHDNEDAAGQEDRIHFNKIYAIVETGAPAGYDLDPTPHFFVIPKETEFMIEDFDFESGSYFYHENWPAGVAVINDKKNEVPRYDFDFRNEKAPLRVTKNIVGSSDGFQANVPFKFGIWANNVEPTKDNALYTVTITYREEDFAEMYISTSTVEGKTLTHYYYENGGEWICRTYDGNQLVSGGSLGSQDMIPENAVKTYGIKPGHQRTVNFPELEYGTYRIYEMNDAGYPINYQSGTINGVEYKVTTGGDADANGVIHYGAEKNKVTVTNATYKIGVTKQFYYNKTDSHAPIVGDYRFGLWEAKDVTTETYTGGNNTPPHTSVSAKQEDMIESVTISWERDEVNNPDMQTKTEWFTDLEPGTQYYIFELDENGDPVPYDYRIGENESKTPLRHIAALENNNFGVIYPRGNTSATPAPGMGGDSEMVVVENEPQYANLPRTGGIGTQVYTQAGTILILLGLGYYGWLMWHRRERRNW